MRSILALALALLIAAPAMAQHSGLSVGVDARNGATPPTTNRALPWTDPATGIMYFFNPEADANAGLWLPFPIILEMSRTTNDFSGPLKFGNNIDSDTTTTSNAMHGYVMADSVYVSAWTFHSENAGGTEVDTKVQLFRCLTGGTVLDILLAGDKGDWDSNQLHAVDQAVFGGPGTYAVYVFDGVQEPYGPNVWFTFYRSFWRP